ncbi:MAG: nucleotidyl transferase AbiEii/AbiGii toxin family protein [Actinomycetota bacterium]|nr:nucleotidyl transferase AbiEii/AbiGii toxin family protein [Actinomycetota bacterium]
MLPDGDRRRVKESFGADDHQVERDYLISHVLAVLSTRLPDRVKFYGGTALARTFLPEGRLSEDIDLIALGRRQDVAAAVETAIANDLAREFGRPTFTPTLADTRVPAAAFVQFPSGAALQIQLLPEDHYAPWPFEARVLDQRFAGVPPATLLVPTLPSFVAWKTTAWLDRRSPRDLWDLAALAQRGAVDAEAAMLFRRLGPYTSQPSEASLPSAPSEDAWRQELAHQTRLTLTAADARAEVVRAWSRLN